MKMKAILAASLLLVTLLFVSGCSPKKNPYELNDQDSFTYSVKYDANGGLFTDNTTVIVDSYQLSELPVNGQGKAELALLSPDHPSRGTDAFTARNNGHFLAGWYTERSETEDAAGNTVYTYSGKWDFEESVLEVNPNGDYSAAEPQVTLYAAWIPLFEVKLYSLQTGEELNALTFDPTTTEALVLPAWNEQTGTVDMNSFPELTDYTFNGAYFDAQGTEPVTTDVLAHPGTIDPATGTASNTSMDLYIDYLEGEWYHIYNAAQFADNASLKGNYILHDDLDFSDEIWPTSLMYGNFTGTIQGNGYTIRNVDLYQTNNSKVNAGLFGKLSDTAKITDVTFDNASVTIEAGTRVKGTSFGLFAGTIAEEAVLENVTVTNSTLKIDSGCYFGADDYVIGLVCGMGSDSKLDPSGITCVAVGDAPETVNITVNGNTVTLEISE